MLLIFILKITIIRSAKKLKKTREKTRNRGKDSNIINNKIKISKFKLLEAEKWAKLKLNKWKTLKVESIKRLDKTKNLKNLAKCKKLSFEKSAKSKRPDFIKIYNSFNLVFFIPKARLIFI